MVAKGSNQRTMRRLLKEEKVRWNGTPFPSLLHCLERQITTNKTKRQKIRQGKAKIAYGVGTTYRQCKTTISGLLLFFPLCLFLSLRTPVHAFFIFFSVFSFSFIFSVKTSRRSWRKTGERIARRLMTTKTKTRRRSAVCCLSPLCLDLLLIGLSFPVLLRILVCCIVLFDGPLYRSFWLRTFDGVESDTPRYSGTRSPLVCRGQSRRHGTGQG